MVFDFNSYRRRNTCWPKCFSGPMEFIGSKTEFVQYYKKHTLKELENVKTTQMQHKWKVLKCSHMAFLTY